VTGPRNHRWARRLGIALGAGLVVTVAAFSRIPSTGGTLGADVTFLAGSTGELDVSPSGAFVQGLDLRPGSARLPADGILSIRNVTGSTLVVRVRALPSVDDLDRRLRVQLTSGTTDVYTGMLGGLRGWTRGFPLAAGEDVDLHVSAAIEDWVTRHYQGRVDDVTLELDSDIPSEGAPGANVTFQAEPTTGLEMSPAGSFGEGLDLRPGAAPAEGTVSIRNVSGSPLVVRARALPSAEDLDRRMRVEVTAGDTVVYSGMLAGLRDGTGGFTVAAGHAVNLHVSAAIEDWVTRKYQGLVDHIAFEFDTEAG
jgi:hypothetical protein